MICTNCPHKCDIQEGATGICHARSNRDGRLVCDNYGAVSSLALDPIEKKPLAMFHPGSKILSVGSYGCNMRCMWCQNDSISRGYVECDHLTPAELVRIANDARGRGNIGVAFTYNEPSIGYEFVYDCSKLAHEAGLLNVSVTNGMLSHDRFLDLLPHIDAYNIDLKTSDSSKYILIGGDLDTILCNIESAAAAGKHVELTTLVVPDFNDKEDDFSSVADLIAAIDRSIPLHITRFFPAGNMRDALPTDLALLYRFKEIALGRRDNVFLGTV